MDQNVIMNDSVDTLFHSLENFTQKEGIMGKPVTQGDKTFIPIVSVTLGYGSGNTAGKGQPTMGSTNTNMSGGAQGLGAKLCTDAILMIDKDNVQMLPVNSSASNLIDKIPQMVQGMTSKGQSSQQGQSSQSSTQGMGQSTMPKH